MVHCPKMAIYRWISPTQEVNNDGSPERRPQPEIRASLYLSSSSLGKFQHLLAVRSVLQSNVNGLCCAIVTVPLKTKLSRAKNMPTNMNTRVKPIGRFKRQSCMPSLDRRCGCIKFLSRSVLCGNLICNIHYCTKWICRPVPCDQPSWSQYCGPAGTVSMSFISNRVSSLSSWPKYILRHK